MEKIYDTYKFEGKQGGTTLTDLIDRMTRTFKILLSHFIEYFRFIFSASATYQKSFGNFHQPDATKDTHKCPNHVKRMDKFFVKSKVRCASACLQDVRCCSFSVAAKIDEAGNIMCELYSVSLGEGGGISLGEFAIREKCQYLELTGAGCGTNGCRSGDERCTMNESTSVKSTTEVLGGSSDSKENS